MNETEKKKQFEIFESNVKWLRNAIPRDDVYDFAEQTLMACDYFIYKLNELSDLPNEGVKDPLLEGWLKNIMFIRRSRKEKYQGIIQVSMRLVDEDNNSRDSNTASADET